MVAHRRALRAARAGSRWLLLVLVLLPLGVGFEQSLFRCRHEPALRSERCCPMPVSHVPLRGDGPGCCEHVSVPTTGVSASASALPAPALLAFLPPAVTGLLLPRVHLQAQHGLPGPAPPGCGPGSLPLRV